MPDYSKEEFARLIQAYNDEMMLKYRDRLQRQNTPTSKTVPVVVTEVPPTGENTRVLEEHEVQRPNEENIIEEKGGDESNREKIEIPEKNQPPVSQEQHQETLPYNLEKNTESIEEQKNSVQENSQPQKNMAEEAENPTQENTENGFSDEEMESRGYLQVRVSTGNQAIPIENANISVTHTINGYLYFDRTMITDEDGLTPIISLYTKSPNLSLTPGNTKPYNSYTITVTADGYYPERFVDVPVYGGVTSIQSVNLIPLAEGGNDDMTLVYPETGPTDL